MICSCGKEIKIYPNSRYKRKFPELCQLCALTKTRCEARSNPIHGHRTMENGKPKRSKLYVKWVNMKCSCYTTTYKDYRLVGAKGIIVCKEWQTFQGFKKWADSKYYKDGMILKRIDNTKNFEPSNCKFIALRANKMYQFGNEVHTIHTLKKKLNSTIPAKNIRLRLEKNWPLADAFLQPLGYKLGRNKRRDSIQKSIGTIEWSLKK